MHSIIVCSSRKFPYSLKKCIEKSREDGTWKKEEVLKTPKFGGWGSIGNMGGNGYFLQVYIEKKNFCNLFIIIFQVSYVTMNIYISDIEKIVKTSECFIYL